MTGRSRRALPLVAGLVALGAVNHGGPAAHALLSTTTTTSGPTSTTTTSTTTTTTPVAGPNGSGVSLTPPADATLTWNGFSVPASHTDAAGLTVTSSTAYNVTVQASSATLTTGATSLHNPLTVAATGVGALGPVAVGTGAVKLISSSVPALVPTSYPLTYSQPVVTSDSPGSYSTTLTFTAASGT